MQEISLHILDLAQNAVSAGATRIRIAVLEDSRADTLTVTIQDNGHGMPPAQLKRANDPFFTTRTTRRVGLGIPLFEMAASLTGGSLTLDSQEGQGTALTAVFGRSHIDRPPLGDIASTMKALVMMHPDIDFTYHHEVDENQFTLDTKEMKEILGAESITGEALSFVGEFIKENYREIARA